MTWRSHSSPVTPLYRPLPSPDPWPYRKVTRALPKLLTPSTHVLLTSIALPASSTRHRLANSITPLPCDTHSQDCDTSFLFPVQLQRQAVPRSTDTSSSTRCYPLSFIAGWFHHPSPSTEDQNGLPIASSIFYKHRGKLLWSDMPVRPNSGELVPLRHHSRPRSTVDRKAVAWSMVRGPSPYYFQYKKDSQNHDNPHRFAMRPLHFQEIKP
jgi:hypothetical protein